MPMSESLMSLFTQLLFFKERREQFTHVPLYKGATVSESLMTTERWEGFALFHEQNARKTNERIPNPDFQPCFRIELKMY